MRISDWSSDVCSSDLACAGGLGGIEQDVVEPAAMYRVDHFVVIAYTAGQGARAELGDRKSVVEGKSVSVRVDLGGRRILTQKTRQTTVWSLACVTKHTTQIRWAVQNSTVQNPK